MTNPFLYLMQRAQGDGATNSAAVDVPRYRKPRLPPLPLDDTKIIYRPQVDLQLPKWFLLAVTHAIGRASKMSQKDFYDNIRIQVQHVENLIIASTPNKDIAYNMLLKITSIQLGGSIYAVKANVRTPEGISKGVIYNILPGTSEEELLQGIRVSARYTVLAARMLGRSSTALIYFDGPHVPYNIIYQCCDYRSKPYRKSVQYCRTCGELGHRQDICPKPLIKFCYKCGKENQLEDHDCRPACKICQQPHETAGKEWRQKLKLNPPPYKIRLHWENKLEEQQRIAKRLHTTRQGESQVQVKVKKRVTYSDGAARNAGAQEPTETERHLVAQLQEQQALIEKLLRRCKENDTANQASKPQGAPPITEDRVKEIVAMEGDYAQLQQHITVQLAPILATFQELSTFVSYAKQNHVTKATVEKMLNSTEAARKKARKDLHNASRPSMTVGEDRETAQDGE
ncbi:hypothetical protein HPB50_014193 [Hyalomma asiaticum]|uniref:Uncharacterized protein n=1 Tax=Hyalomma asiaticum TaxID=266040 RepID=A0ACB7RUL3_HYAAI|nr:hypothetical protein HPB50_014193 [Hyalomma asiaticum]